jgi:small subunit ribosomal protein S2
VPPSVSIKQLLEAGVHFGHQTERWDPRMRRFIFTERNGIHIIDLQQTVQLLDAAYTSVREIVAGGGSILFVGTKKQAQETIESEARRCRMPWVSNRWLGGTLTNFQTIAARVEHLIRLEDARDRGDFDRLPKKEMLKLQDEIERLNRHFGGIKEMDRLPSALYIVDVPKEQIAVTEALRLHIPIVAMCDSNSNPDVIDYPIPSNDDAIRAIRLITGHVAEAVLEGSALREFAQSEEADLEGVDLSELTYSASPDEDDMARTDIGAGDTEGSAG